MRYIKLIRFDLAKGPLQRPMIFVMPMLIALISCVDLAFKLDGLNSIHYFGEKAQASFGDFMMYLYSGIDRFPNPANPPVRWAAVFLTGSFLTLHYPYRDMQGMGQQILIRTGGRTAWWLSKCCWNVLSTVVYHTMMFLTAAVFCGMTKGVFRTAINHQLAYGVLQIEKEQMAADTAAWTFGLLFVPVLVSVGIGLLQMCLALWIKPMCSFLITAVYLIGSAYVPSPWLLGNYAMVIRFDAAVKDGVSAPQGVLIWTAIVLLCAAAGSLKFRRYDILNRD